MQKIKQGDEVVVVTGKDKGKQSKVVKVLDDNKVLVSGVNTVKNINAVIQI
jgi:large subunit ribosomal protein L24